MNRRSFLLLALALPAANLLPPPPKPAERLQSAASLPTPDPAPPKLSRWQREYYLRSLLDWPAPTEGRVFAGVDWGANSQTASFWVCREDNGKLVVLDRRPRIKVKAV